MAESRLKKLYSTLESKGFEAMVFNAGPSLSYLTGLDFHLMERPVVIAFSADSDPVIVLPELEQPKLDKLQFPVKVFAYGENPATWQNVFTEAMSSLGLSGGNIGVEPGRLRFLEYSYLNNTVSNTFVDGSAVISLLRSQKETVEIEYMRKAVQIAEQALEETFPLMGVGVTEREIASELFLRLIKNGSQTDLPFSPIVAAGPNGANPHATPSDRPLTEGDLLIIDWGARYNGYCSDLTRTFAVGEVDKEAQQIHKAVLMANRAGRHAGEAGIACKDIDKAARKEIEDAGYGKYFNHRTGHGIGLECHEDPYMHGENDQPLEMGNCYTVEPGIYLAGSKGVRIEDDVVVTENGAESLSTMTRVLRQVG